MIGTKTSLHIINGDDFIDEMKAAMLEATFFQMLSLRGLDDLLIGATSAGQILQVKKGQIYKYATIGKEDVVRNRHIQNVTTYLLILLIINL